MLDVLAISYSWQGFGDPDSTGDRLQAIADFLQGRIDLNFVWWDFPCSRRTRTS